MKWNPISERPPESGWYLIWLVAKDPRLSGYTWEPALWMDGEWQMDDMGQLHHNNVTHWMKIDHPKP